MTNTKINKLKVGAMLSYVSMGIGYVISIAYTPIMLKLLGQSEYGLYNLVSSVVSYLGLLSFGFGSAYIRYYSKYKVKNEKEKVAKLNGMFLTVFSIIGFICIIFGGIFVANIETILGNNLTVYELETAKTLMLIMVFNIAISFPGSVFNSYIVANEEYIFQKILNILKTVVNPFVMLPILIMGYKSVGIVVATTFINITVELANIIFCMKKIKMEFSFKNFEVTLLKEISVFSSFIFINMIIDQVNWSVDKFILGRCRGTVAVAVYGVAAQLNTYYLSLSSVISNMFIPRVNMMIMKGASNKEITNLFTRVGRIQFIILSSIWSGLIIFGRPFIRLWAGEAYADAYFIVLLLILPATIPLIQNLGIEIQKAKNMHKFRSIMYLIIAVVNVLISIPLANLYGGIGSAFGTGLSLLVGNGIIMNWYYKNKIGINVKFFWCEIVKILRALIIPIWIGGIMMRYINLYNIKSLLICGFIYCIIYSISLWLFGMNEYEKNLFLKPLQKVIKYVKKK